MTIAASPPPKALVKHPVQRVYPREEKDPERNERIRQAYAALPKRGALPFLAREYGVSIPRIHQIVFGRSPR